MKILIIGSENQYNTLSNKLGDKHSYTYLESVVPDTSFFEQQEVLFDFTIEEETEGFDVYSNLEHLTVFINVPKLSLAEVAYYTSSISCRLFGFNGLPTFFDGELWEISAYSTSDHKVLNEICNSLSIQYKLVDDRIGMVAPRVVCMIINEAYFTVQEGTASKEDIDKGMKLGTNYPYGPFEWCAKIGVNHVYELLEAVYNDTKDERYKICPLLKKEYLELANN